MKRTYSFWKRAVAVLTSTALAVTMCVPALAWGSSNGAAESAQIITCNVSVKAKNFGNGEASSATTLSGVTLNDGWLTATNTAAYNGQLATWASVVATAAYKDDTTVTVTSRAIGSGTGASTAAVEGAGACTAPGAQLLANYGFEDIEYVRLQGSSYTQDQDDITAVVMAHKLITVQDENNATQTVDAYLLAIQGTDGTEAQWKSNFDVGDTNKQGEHRDWKTAAHHKGFDVAAARVDRVLAAYMQERSGANKTLLITGHSRGAAIANILGAEYEQSTLETPSSTLCVGAYGGSTPTHTLSAVQTYTFASPAVTTGSVSRSTVFNICNSNDFISAMPLESWGFKRYGTDIAFDVANNAAITSNFKTLTGSDYDSPDVNALVELFKECAKGRQELYSEGVESVVRSSTLSYVEENHSEAVAAVQALGVGYCVEIGAVHADAEKDTYSFTKKIKPQLLLTSLAGICANSSNFDKLIPLLGNTYAVLSLNDLESVFSGIMSMFMMSGDAFFYPHYTATYYSIAKLTQSDPGYGSHLTTASAVDIDQNLNGKIAITNYNPARFKTVVASTLHAAKLEAGSQGGSPQGEGTDSTSAPSYTTGNSNYFSYASGVNSSTSWNNNYMYEAVLCISSSLPSDMAGKAHEILTAGNIALSSTNSLESPNCPFYVYVKYVSKGSDGCGNSIVGYSAMLAESMPLTIKVTETYSIASTYQVKGATYKNGSATSYLLDSGDFPVGAVGSSGNVSSIAQGSSFSYEVRAPQIGAFASIVLSSESMKDNAIASYAVSGVDGAGYVFDSQQLLAVLGQQSNKQVTVTLLKAYNPAASDPDGLSMVSISGTNIVFDLGGYSIALSGWGELYVSGDNVTVKNGTINGGADSFAVAHTCGNAVRLDNLNINSKHVADNFDPAEDYVTEARGIAFMGGSLDLSAVKVSMADSNARRNFALYLSPYLKGTDSIATVNSGTFDGELKVPDPAALEVRGGSFRSNPSAYVKDSSLHAGSMGGMYNVHALSPTGSSGKAPTCTEPGYGPSSYCSTCGNWLSGGATIPAKGHSWGEWAVTTAPACEAEGVQSRTCSACGASEEQALPAIGHSWSAWTTIIAATFLAPGTEERGCSACGATEQRSIAQLEEKKGAEFAQGNADYVISSVKSQTVAYAAPARAKAKKNAVLTVPLSVKVGNERYAVRGIEPKAFAGTKATKLVIEAKGLSKKSLRNCLKGSKIQRVVVRAYKSTKKNEDYALLLKKYLAKSNSGRNVKVSW